MSPPPVWCVITQQWWHLSPSDSTALWWSLVHSRYARPTALRQHVSVVRAVGELQHLLTAVVSPQTVINTIEDLVHEGRLSRKRASRIEQYIVARVDEAGRWKKEGSYVDSAV